MMKPSLSTISLLSSALLACTLLPGCDRTSPSGSAASVPAASSGAPQESLQGASLESVLAERDPYTRVRELATLLPTLGPEAVAQVPVELRKGRGRLGAADFDLLVRYWATHDPKGASEWAIVHAPPLYKNSAIRTAVELWAKSDPAAALAGVSGAAQSGIRDLAQSVQLGLVKGWFQADRPGLEKYIEGLGMGVQRQRSIMDFTLALQQAEGSDAVMRWAESIPDADKRYKASVYRQATSALAWTDVDAAMRWCEKQCEGPYGRGLRAAIARSRLSDGEYGGDVVEWVASAPEGENKVHALRITYGTWATRDRQGAVDWMKKKVSAKDPEPWLHELYGAYARQLAASSPAEAMPWAERVDNEAAREELMVRIARRWLREDPKAAEAWLAQSPLSEQARARVRNPRMPDYLPEAAGAAKAAPQAAAPGDAEEAP